MLEIGVILPPPAVGVDVATAARHAEGAGLDGVWHGDHLAAPGMPTLDCLVALGVAAAVTRQVRVGSCVLVPGLRPLVWTAKQVATVQHLSGGRFVLGIGSGTHPAQWAAAGVPWDRRGASTDIAAELLPRLVAGEPVGLPDGEPERPEIALTPAVTPPPVWVGNDSSAALRRAARFGDGWFPSLVPAGEVAAGAVRLGELAATYGRPTPVVAVGVTGAVGVDPSVAAAIADRIAGAYGIPAARAATLPVVGEPAAVAERFAAYAEAGATTLAFGIAGGDWRRQCDLLATVRSLLR